MKEPRHRFQGGDKVIDIHSNRKGIVNSISIGHESPLAYVQFDEENRPEWIRETDLDFEDNPSRR